MTRLVSGWIADIENEMAALDAELREKTGLTMAELAAKSAGLTAAEFSERLRECPVAAVSVTSGQGTIGSFSGSVAAIAAHLGAEAFVPLACDVDGFYEAAKRGAGVIFMADDDRFIAVNRLTGRIGENDIATATGYATALDAMAGGLYGKRALLLGCGRMGRLAADALDGLGAEVCVYDKADAVFGVGFPYRRVTEKAALRDFRYVLDATCEGDWLRAGDLAPDVCIAAPGVPFSLSEDARAMYGAHCYHDVLPLGTAVMLALAL